MPRFVIKGFVWNPFPQSDLGLAEPTFGVVFVSGGEDRQEEIPENGFPYAFEADGDFAIVMAIDDVTVYSVAPYSDASRRVSVLYPAVDDFGPMLERTYTVLFRKTGRPKLRSELLVYYRFEDDRAGLTTPPALPARIEVEDEDLAAPLTLSGSASGAGAGAGAGASSAVATSSNVVHEADPFCYLVMPGNYSGDSWAVAFALLLDPRVRVALITKGVEATESLAEASDVVEQVESKSIFVRTTLQFWNLCVALGVGDLEKRVLLDTSLKGSQVGESTVAKVGETVITKDIGTLHQPPDVTFCGWTFASSSVILHAAERLGLQTVLETIQTAVTTGVELEQYLTGVLEVISSAGPCVLINMRIGRRGNHPQHDINEALYAQIAGAIAAADYLPIRIGTYQNAEFTPGGQWIEDLTGPWVEIFPKGVAVNRQQIATFWHQVAQLPNVFGIIGGRSGSLDIAAIMGVRTLCWDIVDPTDQEYIRQLLYAPFMSICPRSGGELTKKIKDKTEPMPGSLSQPALALWLAGHAVVPRSKVDPETAYLQLFKLAELRTAEVRKRIFLRLVRFMDLFQGEGGGGAEMMDELPGGFYDELTETVTANDGTVYDVGRAPGGGNCFYHCVAAIVNDGRSHGQIRQALRDFAHLGDTERVRVGTDGEDATDGDITAMARMLDRPIVIHTVAYGGSVTQEQTIAHDATGVPIHILHRYDPLDAAHRGHYDPMTPQG